MKRVIPSIAPFLLALGGCGTIMDYPPQWPKVDESATSPCMDIAGIYYEVSDPRPDKGGTCPDDHDIEFACASLSSVFAHKRVRGSKASSDLVEVKQTDEQLRLFPRGQEFKSKTLTRGVDYQCSAHQIDLLLPPEEGGGGFGAGGGAAGYFAASTAMMKATDGSLIVRTKSFVVAAVVAIGFPVPLIGKTDIWWRWRPLKPD